jgi:hypothetical protein
LAFAVSKSVGAPIRRFVPYRGSDEAFQHEVSAMAASAASAAGSMDAQFESVTAVAEHYAEHPNRWWSRYHRAVALALSGDTASAIACFQSVAADANRSDIEWVRRMGHSAADHAFRASRDDGSLRAAIAQQIARTRAGLRMPEIDDPFDWATTHR